VTELEGPSCDIWGGIVSQVLMGFHRDWHDAQAGRGTRFFAEATDTDEPSLEQVLTVIAALRAVPMVSARPEFVADLRERLVTEGPSDPQAVPDRGGTSALETKRAD
jgi:hypothetical protein